MRRIHSRLSGPGQASIWHSAFPIIYNGVAARQTPRVIMKSFFRPNRSVSQPKTRAPTQAPATYVAAPNPVIWLCVMWMPLPGMLI